MKKYVITDNRKKHVIHHLFAENVYKASVAARELMRDKKKGYALFEIPVNPICFNPSKAS